MRTEIKLGIIVGMLVVGGTIVYFLNQGTKGSKNVADVVPLNPPASSTDAKRTTTPAGTRGTTPTATPRTPGTTERPPAAVPGERPATPSLARPPVTAPPVPGGPTSTTPPAGSAPTTPTLPPGVTRPTEPVSSSRPGESPETGASLVPRPVDMPTTRPSVPPEPTPGARPTGPTAPLPGTTPPRAGTPTPSTPGTRTPPTPTPTSTREPSTTARPTEKPPAAEPAGKKYTVGEGDTLWAIAQEVYGDGNLWPKIRAANPSLSDENRLLVGQELTIPPKEDKAKSATPSATPTAAKPAASEPKTAAKPPTTDAKTGGNGTGKQATTKPETGNGSKKGAKATETNTAAKTHPRTYVVEKGDTLASIARSILKDGSRWREIYELNKSRIKNPDHLLVGTELKLPEK